MWQVLLRAWVQPTPALPVFLSCCAAQLWCACLGCAASRRLTSPCLPTQARQHLPAAAAARPPLWACSLRRRCTRVCCSGVCWRRCSFTMMRCWLVMLMVAAPPVTLHAAHVLVQSRSSCRPLLRRKAWPRWPRPPPSGWRPPPRRAAPASSSPPTWKPFSRCPLHSVLVLAPDFVAMILQALKCACGSRSWPARLGHGDRALLLAPAFPLWRNQALESRTPAVALRPHDTLSRPAVAAATAQRLRVPRYSFAAGPNTLLDLDRWGGVWMWVLRERHTHRDAAAAALHDGKEATEGRAVCRMASRCVHSAAQATDRCPPMV